MRRNQVSEEFVMEMRKLGRSSLETAPLVFGGNVFGWTTDEAMSFKLLDAFVDAGFTLIDTADVYSKWFPGNKGGESEVIMGNWLASRGNRDKVVIASKFGLEWGPGQVGLSPKYMMESIEGSLRRLKTDYIDLYQSHVDDPDTPIEATLEAYARLIEQGKVREIGASNFSAERFKESLDISTSQGLPRYQTLQPHYSLVERDIFEGPLQDVCVAEDISVISFFSLASGFLTGKYRSRADMEGQARGVRVEQYCNDRGFAIVAALDVIADRHNAKPGQIALAWLMTRPAVAAPIASATNMEQFAELIASVDIKLTQEDIDYLDKASA